MVGKYLFFCLLIFFNININASEIIYNKNNILITKQDLDQYKLIEKNTNYLNDNIVIKEIVLIKRTNNNLKKNNPLYYEQTINQIKSKNIYVDEVNQDFLEQYLFYINVRNDIAKEFMINKFKKDQIQIIFKNEDITFGLSKNKCMTILKTLSINQLNNKEIYDILDRKIINFKFEKNLDDQKYDVCLSEKNINQVINIFNSYIIDESREDFLKFIYEKK